MATILGVVANEQDLALFAKEAEQVGLEMIIENGFIQIRVNEFDLFAHDICGKTSWCFRNYDNGFFTCKALHCLDLLGLNDEQVAFLEWSAKFPVLLVSIWEGKMNCSPEELISMLKYKYSSGQLTKAAHT